MIYDNKFILAKWFQISSKFTRTRYSLKIDAEHGPIDFDNSQTGTN